MFTINLKIALRNLWKNKFFSLINIGGLAIGLSCCLLLLLYVNYEWSYDKQFANADRIYTSWVNLEINGKLYTTASNPNRLAAAAKQSIPAVEEASRIAQGNSVKLFSRNENHFKLNSLNVDPSFLKIFSYKFLYGNPVTALNAPDGLLLTASSAKKLFGNENPLGQRVKWDNRRELKVTAVIEDLPKNQSVQFDALQGWSFFDQENPTAKFNGWGSITCSTVFMLKENSDFAAADKAVRRLVYNNEKEAKLAAFLAPYSEFHLYNEFTDGKPSGGRIEQVKLFLFLAFCVLLIACINYMNLSTARSEKRAREVGVRKALGSARVTLMGQFMMESVLLSLISMVIAFTFLELSLPYFNHLLDINIFIDYSSYLFWSVLAGLVLITGLLAGSYPAFYLSSFSPIKVLKGFTAAGSSSLPIRKILVVLQFSLSICMIICAIIIYTQIQFIKNKPLGFSQDNLVQLDLEGEWRKPGKAELFKASLLKEGAITSATEYFYSFTNSDNITSDLVWPGKPLKDNSIINYNAVGYDFIKTIGASLVAGRDFSVKFKADLQTSILLNESAVKMMQLKNPVGTRLTWGTDPPLTVVGVIKDFNNGNQGSKIEPAFYYYNPGVSNVLMLRLNPEQSLSKSIETIKNVSQQLNPSYPANLEFISENMEQKLRGEKLLSVLSNLFGGFAILISCLGLLGLALYMAEQRKKEVSIRKVLGASLQDILVLLNKDFMKLVMISNVIAFPIAYIVANNWLKKYDYKIDIALWPFLIAALLSLIIAIFTVSIQTFKVAKANAVDALKYE